MRSGRSNKCVGQAGEFLVCAELGKRGLIATLFAGNVPGFDVLVVDEKLRCLPVQVKTSSGTSFITGDIGKYVEIKYRDKRLVLGEPVATKYPDLIRVYVVLGRGGERDRFFVLTEKEFCDVLVANLREWIVRIDGVRPRNPRSTHSVISMSRLEPFEDRWELVFHRLAQQSPEGRL